MVQSQKSTGWSEKYRLVRKVPLTGQISTKLVRKVPLGQKSTEPGQISTVAVLIWPVNRYLSDGNITLTLTLSMLEVGGVVSDMSQKVSSWDLVIKKCSNILTSLLHYTQTAIFFIVLTRDLYLWCSKSYYHFKKKICDKPDRFQLKFFQWRICQIFLSFPGLGGSFTLRIIKCNKICDPS